MITMVVWLHVPSTRQVTSGHEHRMATSTPAAVTASWLHDDQQEANGAHAPHALTVAERHFYLQKSWGG